MLIGQVNMEGAWNILDKMYGNRTMLANKLKTKLKTIKASGKQDHDIVLHLVIEIKGIVNRLTTLGLDQMLRYDDEYISAVFKALPSSERMEWLKFEKSSFESEWEALLVFVDQAHDRANSIKAHLTNYAANSSDTDELKCRKCHKKGHIKRDCLVAVTNIQKDPEDSEGEAEIKSDAEYVKKLKEKCGKCPVCKERHTFTRKRDKKNLPSDCLMCCEQFRQMSERERGEMSKLES